MIALRFDTEKADYVSPILLSFTFDGVQLRLIASPEVCEWYPGGGFIDANPVLPPLDFKVPITPQVRRSYIMQPQLSCIRVSDGLAIVLSNAVAVDGYTCTLVDANEIELVKV